MNKLLLTRWVCRFLPPIIAQTVRTRIIAENAGGVKEFEFKRRAFTGGILTGNTKDFHAFRFYIHGYYDWKNIVLAKHFLKINRGDFIEVGANVGTETVSLAYLNQKYKVHAFEPLISNSGYLATTKDENNFKNLFIYNLLVTDKPGIINFKLPEIGNSGSGYITKNQDNGTVNLKAVTLDKELSNINSCSAIFIDVEGYEYNVILGGKEIITKFKPFIILEVNSFFLKERANITVATLLDTLNNMGYSCYFVNKIRLEEVDINNFKDNKNWICIPAERENYRKQLSQALFINAFNPMISNKIF